MITSKKFNLYAMLLLMVAAVTVTSCKDETEPEDEGTNGGGNGEIKETYTLTPQADGIASFAGYDAGTQTLTMTSQNEWILDGKVYVNDGQTLKIEPGTVIKCTERSNSDATALVIARGAKILAEGNASAPIIFTSTADDLNSITDLPLTATGLWGGIAVLGKGIVGSDNPTQNLLEGLDENEPRSFFGGNNNADNSGVMKYVSIRYTGAEVSQGNEIQGLTMGGVGSGTTIDHVEVFGSSDDGIEIFGGSVNVTHFAVWNSEDDCFDLDFGWKGWGQFWFSLKSANAGDHNGEWDGAKPDDNSVYTKTSVYNATFIGSGVGAPNADNDLGIIERDGSTISIGNSIFLDINGKAFALEDKNQDFDSYKKFMDGEAAFVSNIFSVGGLTEISADAGKGILIASNDGETPREADIASLVSHVSGNNNMIANPGISVSRASDNGLDPRPTASEATANVASVPSGMMTTNYKGAFQPGAPTWLSGWSALSTLGVLVD